MASADLRAELECAVCLSIYRDPVMLRCGHNFCRRCIDRVLDTSKGSGGYSCPECKKSYRRRPTLQRNRKLRNIVDRFLSVPLKPKPGILCTQCLHMPVSAVMSCLMCEASLCEDHLRVHSKAPEHILCPPTTSMEDRKCSVHKEILKYYCTEDSTCICVSCRLDGEHRGHQVSSIEEASEKKKEKLRDDLQKVMAEMEEAEKSLQSLQERRRNAQEKAAGETERVTAMFRDLRRRLEELEKRVLGDIARWAEREVMYYDESTEPLEIKKEELSRKMGHIEELCNMADPLTVLQEATTGDLCDTEEGDNEDRERHDEELHDGGDLDVAAISHTLHTGLSDIMSGVNMRTFILEAAEIVLDINTTHNVLHISDDGKTASRTNKKQNHPKTAERFQADPQVLSVQSFSSGRHCWEVEVGGSDSWRVGMCYPTMFRTEDDQSQMGSNSQSWCLDGDDHRYSAIHDSQWITLSDGISSNRVRVELDYEAGRISFYALCDPIRPLHTFTTTFTEPLHAVIGVWEGCVKIPGGHPVTTQLEETNEGNIQPQD